VGGSQRPEAPAETTEARIALALGRRDADALAGVYDRLGPAAFALALAIAGGERERAAAAVEAAFARIAAEVDDADGRLTLDAWVLTLVRQEARLLRRVPPAPAPAAVAPAPADLPRAVAEAVALAGLSLAEAAERFGLAKLEAAAALHAGLEAGPRLVGERIVKSTRSSFCASRPTSAIVASAPANAPGELRDGLDLHRP
jgi:DNA-directed RNA polymerase specialized sigma24 family protein